MNVCGGLSQVTAMSRQVKSHVVRTVDPSAQGITASTVPSLPVSTLDNPTRREDDHFQAQGTSDPRELHRSETVNANADESGDKQIAASPKESDTTFSSARHRAKPIPKSADRTLMIAQSVPSGTKPVVAGTGSTVVKGTWTQVQQKQLESALNQVPKGASDRWDRIAELVPDKTKVFNGVYYRWKLNRTHGFRTRLFC